MSNLQDILQTAPSQAGTRFAGNGAGQKMVFVGGLHRSGTTHLAKLLGQHPDASVMTKTGVMMDEGQYLQDVYPQDWQTGGPGSFAFAPQAHLTEQDSEGRADQIRARLIQQWAPYWDMSRPVLIEKTPGNLLTARFLQSVFGEDAYFVFITRHPIAVSLATRKWSHTSLFALMEHWLTAHAIARADMPHLRNVLCVSYEALVADPAATLAEIQHFIGLRPVTAPLAMTDDANQGYFDTWRSYYRADSPYAPPPQTPSGAPMKPSAWRRLVWFLRGRARHYLLLRRGMDFLSTFQEGRAVLARFERQVSAFGYSLTELDQCPATAPAVAAPAPVVDPARALVAA